VLIDLLVKELTMLALLAAVGAGFARALRGRLDGASQLALAPVFGFAVSISLLTTLNFFVPLRNALWFALLPAAVASLAFAIWRWGAPLRPRAHWRELAQLGAVLVGVLVVVNAPLVRRDSPGPIDWGIYDAPYYVDCVAGFENNLNRNPVLQAPTELASHSHDQEAWKPVWDLGARGCWGTKYFHTAAETLPAAIVNPTGWAPWEMSSPFMALCIVLIAFGAFALFRVLTRSQSWLSIAPGLAMAGAALFQLYIDGSAALLAGITFIPALLTVGVLTVRRLSWRTTLLGAVLLAGLQTAYAVIGVIVVVLLFATLAVAVAMYIRAGTRVGPRFRRDLTHLVVAGAIAAALSPRAALWALTSVSESGALTTSVIRYHMQLPHLFGWLLQTREFYSFSLTSPHGTAYVLVGILLPLALIVAGLYACVRRGREAWLLVGFVAAAGLQALYSAIRLDCPYCAERTLVTTVPAIAVLVTAGVFELTRSRGGWRWWSAAVLAAVGVIAAATSLLSLEHRAVRGAFMPSADLIEMADEAGDLVHGTIQLEGFGQTPLWAWGENPTTYQAMIEATGQRVSLDSAYSDYGGLAYDATRPIGDPSYTPTYKYVLTRFGSLDTGRRVLARKGAFALQRRNLPFDATVARGIAVDTYLRDPSGTPWVQRPGNELQLQQGPLTFWVSALSRSDAFLHATFTGPADLRPNGVAHATRRYLGAGRTEICVPVRGHGRLRVVTLPLLPLPGGLTYPGGDSGQSALPYENAPYVAREIRLDKVRVTTGACVPAAGRSH